MARLPSIETSDQTKSTLILHVMVNYQRTKLTKPRVKIIFILVGFINNFVHFIHDLETETHSLPKTSNIVEEQIDLNQVIKSAKSIVAKQYFSILLQFMTVPLPVEPRLILLSRVIQRSLMMSVQRQMKLKKKVHLKIQ